jgi:hypothetical protein
MLISFLSLKSGYSHDIHGIMKIEFGNFEFKLFNYKALDSGVKCGIIGSV